MSARYFLGDYLEMGILQESSDKNGGAYRVRTGDFLTAIRKY